MCAGVAGTSDNNIGVYGTGGNYAGYFDGLLQVNGDINVTGDITLVNGDCAEDFDVKNNEQEITPGTVLVIGDDGKLIVSTEVVFDPYGLTLLLDAITSFIAIFALLYTVDPTSQQTFDQLMAEYRSQNSMFLQRVTNSLQCNYEQAVTGLVPSDLPSSNDILSFLYHYHSYLNSALGIDTSNIGVGPNLAWSGTTTTKFVGIQ